MAEWARANPAGRDALLALTERAVALQPAAEAAVQCCRPGPERPGGLQDAAAARDAYRSLGDHLRALGLAAPVAAELAGLLDRHLEALDLAMAGERGRGPRAGRRPAGRGPRPAAADGRDRGPAGVGRHPRRLTTAQPAGRLSLDRRLATCRTPRPGPGAVSSSD